LDKMFNIYVRTGFFSIIARKNPLEILERNRLPPWTIF